LADILSGRLDTVYPDSRADTKHLKYFLVLIMDLAEYWRAGDGILQGDRVFKCFILVISFMLSLIPFELILPDQSAQILIRESDFN